MRGSIISIKNKTRQKNLSGFFLVGVEGFEPSK